MGDRSNIYLQIFNDTDANTKLVKSKKKTDKPAKSNIYIKQNKDNSK